MFREVFICTSCTAEDDQGGQIQYLIRIFPASEVSEIITADDIEEF